jgi:hypothetical protein
LRPGATTRWHETSRHLTCAAAALSSRRAAFVKRHVTKSPRRVVAEGELRAMQSRHRGCAAHAGSHFL